MDIVCPNCAATYRVPETLVATGKPLRCAACGLDWVPSAPRAAEPPPVPAPAPVSAPAAAPPTAGATPPPAPEGEPLPGASEAERPPLIVNDPRPPVSQGAAAMDRPLTLSWAASVGAVALALALMAVYHQEISAAWPPFARIVGLLGG